MSTRYTYQTTITVTVTMADEGEISELDGEPAHYEPGEQWESARLYAEEAMPLHETYDESWVKTDAPPLAFVKMEPA